MSAGCGERGNRRLSRDAASTRIREKTRRRGRLLYNEPGGRSQVTASQPTSPKARMDSSLSQWETPTRHRPFHWSAAGRAQSTVRLIWSRCEPRTARGGAVPHTAPLRRRGALNGARLGTLGRSKERCASTPGSAVRARACNQRDMCAATRPGRGPSRSAGRICPLKEKWNPGALKSNPIQMFLSSNLTS